jgi:hypothetical protein
MAQAFNRSPLSVEARVRFLVCGSDSGCGTGFALSTLGFRLLVSFHQCAILILFLKSLNIGQQST